MTERSGDWFQTYSGGKFWPLDPKPEEVDIKDIARALSMTCRFNGHVEKFYSVAEHSVHVHRIYINRLYAQAPDTDSKQAMSVFDFLKSPQAQLCALLHDAAEAYMGDVIRPIKRSVPVLKEMEEPILAAVLQKFGLQEVALMAHHSIVEADEIALITEKRDVVADGPGTRKELGEWAGERWLTPDSVIIEPSSPGAAEADFLRVFNRLQARREDGQESPS
jgi:5'-deoxynucleotidase YfbR-like HD superfamily hydrolase